MKIILIRGLPGSGKTTIADKLNSELKNSSVIHVDYFKREFREKDFDKSFDEAKEYAYNKTMKTLSSMFESNKEYIIIEELLYEQDFVDNLNKFFKEKLCKVSAFLIDRPIDELLELESKRKRPIKNTHQDFINIRKGMLKVKLDNEIVISNSSDINNIVKEIVSGLVYNI